MKKSCHWAVLAGVVLSLGYLASGAAAQAPVPAAAAGPKLALLDVSFIFKNHARFKGKMDEMKADVQRAEERVKADRDTIGKLGERLQDFRKGTADYKQMEEELAKRQADLAVQVQLTKNEFLQREANIYHDVYQEILQATDYFCKQHSIDMVLRFNGDAVDVQRPDSVLAWINRPVVWYQSNMDITPYVLKELNRNAGNTGTARQPAPVGVPFSR